MGFSRRDEDQPLRSLDLGAVVKACTGLVGPIFGCGISLKTQVSADLLPVWGHAGKLKQIITNLVMNARDVTPPRGVVLVSAGNRPVDPEGAPGAPDQRAGPMVCLTVTDHGCGMDEATRNRLFEPFFTTNGPGKGTGLGLALVRQLVEQHRGWIEVESTPGAGSTFRVFLRAA
jgi:signal transduction histidine kinase